MIITSFQFNLLEAFFSQFKQFDFCIITNIEQNIEDTNNIIVSYSIVKSENDDHDPEIDIDCQKKSFNHNQFPPYNELFTLLAKDCDKTMAISHMKQNDNTIEVFYGNIMCYSEYSENEGYNIHSQEPIMIPYDALESIEMMAKYTTWAIFFNIHNLEEENKKKIHFLEKYTVAQKDLKDAQILSESIRKRIISDVALYKSIYENYNTNFEWMTQHTDWKTVTKESFKNLDDKHLMEVYYDHIIRMGNYFNKSR